MKNNLVNKEESFRNLIENIDNGYTQKEVIREDKQLRELRKYSEDSKIEYQKNIEDANNSWTKIFQSFLPLVNTVSKLESDKRNLFMKCIDEYMGKYEKIEFYE